MNGEVRKKGKNLGMCISLIIILTIPPFVQAEDTASSEICKGKTVIVFTVDGRKIKGELVRVTPQELTLLTKNSENAVTVITEQIDKVLLRRKLNSLLSISSGFLVGFAVTEEHPDYKWLPQAIIGLGGAGISGLVSLVPSERTFRFRHSSMDEKMSNLFRLNRFARISDKWKWDESMSAPSVPRFQVIWMATIDRYHGLNGKERFCNDGDVRRLQFGYDIANHFTLLVEWQKVKSTDEYAPLTTPGWSYNEWYERWGSIPLLGKIDLQSLSLGISWRPFRTDADSILVPELNFALGPSWLKYKPRVLSDMSETLAQIEHSWVWRAGAAMDFRILLNFFLGAFVEYQSLTLTSRPVILKRDIAVTPTHQVEQLTIPQGIHYLKGVSFGLRVGLKF
jgi:hypothetical protein